MRCKVLTVRLVLLMPLGACVLFASRSQLEVIHGSSWMLCDQALVLLQLPWLCPAALLSDSLSQLQLLLLVVFNSS
jgi:hypothetical protein